MGLAGSVWRIFACFIIPCMTQESGILSDGQHVLNKYANQHHYLSTGRMVDWSTIAYALRSMPGSRD